MIRSNKYQTYCLNNIIFKKKSLEILGVKETLLRRTGWSVSYQFMEVYTKWLIDVSPIGSLS